MAIRFGTPNDEVLHGHPLHGKGLEPYAAHLIANSAWLAELQRINSVHPYYDPARWLSYEHYLLTFHDDTFECIAATRQTEVLRASFADALAIATQRLFTGTKEAGQ
jgi:hypothetical protein